MIAGQTGLRHPRRMETLYDRIGRGYDATRRADPWIARRLAQHLGLRPGTRFLDVGCGTGNYTLALAANGARLTGLDPSATMLEAARRKAGREPSGDRVDWCQARAEAMPFADGTFTGAVAVLCLHHLVDIGAAVREVGRVLDARRGRFVIFTSTRAQMRRYWLGRYFPTLMARSIERMPDEAEVRAALDAAGLGSIGTEPYAVRPDLADRFLYSGKLRPELYLDPAFRAGSSSFATLGDPGEMDDGLGRLARDIETGAIARVIEEAQHPDGDYLFVRAARL